MTSRRCFQTAVLVLMSLICSSIAGAAGMATVKIWEEKVVIPTYEIGEPDPNPRFYNGRAHQGAQGRVYPYAMQDVLTDDRVDKTYTELFLENEYIRISVTPELGGRLFSALDKTNNYDFFYRQHVIKPALIGMLGAWISGGVEWNIFHHHRNTTVMPVDYKLEEHPDGSKTIWVGETERRHRMKWLVGTTLHPGKSYIEVTVKMINRTPLVNSILYFANPAVHIDKTYQVIFPPRTEYVTYHAKRAFTEWPNSYTRYQGREYSGTDISWFKNLPQAVSFFAWNYEDDYFAGYDHGKDAGTAYFGNHHIAPGKKLWTWGHGATGERWDKKLSDEDGPYIEIMAGAYSDNQPDYSWIQPYEVKIVKQYWYPIRQMQGLKFANLDGAVNLEVTNEHEAKIRLNTTSQHKGAKVVLEAEGKKLFEQTIDISPANPYEKDVVIGEEIKPDKVKVSLYYPDGKELLSYKEVKQPGESIPEEVTPPEEPNEIDTVEELYLTGLRLDEFHSARLDSLSYYEEALRRDPGNSRVNTQLGIYYCKRAFFEKAEERLRVAIERISKNYTNPKDGEAYYYLGVALRNQGKYKEAYDALYKATWSFAWHAAAYYQLAEIDSLRGDFTIALKHLDRSLATNQYNKKGLNLKSAVFRKLGRLEQAEEAARQAVSDDPLDFFSGNELYLIKSAKNQRSEASKRLLSLKTLMREEVQSYLELATDYGNCGLWDEAIDVLSRMEPGEGKEGGTDPLIYYYLGYYRHKKGENQKCLEYYTKANKMPAKYCFPFRAETTDVLQDVMERVPSDARAHYYFGNLIFENEPERAVSYWEKSRDLDDSFATVHRNLGMAYTRMDNDIYEAISAYEKAAVCNNEDARIYAELGGLYNRAGVPPDKRVKVHDFETVVKRDDALSVAIDLYVHEGRYDEAIELLTTYHFNIWEGGGGIRNVYVDACLLRGIQNFKDKQYQQALKDFQTALEYPENLEVVRRENDWRSSRIYYFVGTAYEKLGNTDKARESFEKSVSFDVSESEILYYQGLSYLELGQQNEATEIFDKLICTGQERLEKGESLDFFAKFGEREDQAARMASAHYLAGLGYLGKGTKTEAKAEFEKALELNANHLWAAAQLRELK
ncbi:DUF5107 domain-containing protein [Planctomycetota bacterium]